MKIKALDGAVLAAKRAVASVLCSPMVGKVIATSTRNRILSKGCLIETDNDLIEPSMKASLFWGLYESAEVRFVRKHLRGDLDVIELGGGIGVVTCHIASRMNPGKSLMTVEANAQLIEQLERNVRLNYPDLHLSVVHGAIDYENQHPDSTEFLLRKRHIDSSISGRKDNARTVSVPALTLGSIIQRFNIESFALVSDIEGAEAGIIDSESDALVRCEQLIIELHHAWFRGKEYLVGDMLNNLLNRHRFQVRDAHGPVYVLER